MKNQGTQDKKIQKQNRTSNKKGRNRKKHKGKRERQNKIPLKQQRQINVLNKKQKARGMCRVGNVKVVIEHGRRGKRWGRRKNRRNKWNTAGKKEVSRRAGKISCPFL